ncbi:sorting nexin-14-like isoform X2 [Tigriopus californicus]|uniref:sorting nexin-14-like isoform X2 n=1 Tax=Tigriopus californicus TaxID=6832 RepID=UPI0027DA41C4|nr:sorting nexin-14-like isoform X2 [Tigriopus californicus]
MILRVAGTPLSPKLTQKLVLIILAVFISATALSSLSTGLLLLTSFCFGAAAFSLILDLCPNNELPNFLASVELPLIHPGLPKDFSFTDPWRDIQVPIEVDDALNDLYEHILRDYVYSWYGMISYDEEFVQEIRHILRYASSVIVRRLSRVNLATLITRKAIPIGLSHLDACYYARQYARSFKSDYRDAFFDFLGPNAHPATMSRENEVLYIQSVARRLLKHVFPKRNLNSGSVKVLLADILSGSILQPLMDILADPDIINYILETSFSLKSGRVFDPPSGVQVEFLKRFVTTSEPQNLSSLFTDLSGILKDQQTLFAFIKFLREEGGINQLQFFRSIEDFNKKIMNPDLTHQEILDLHNEAVDIFNLYLKSDAIHHVDIPLELVKEIELILVGNKEDVLKLRTTTPLFQAYEAVYTNLVGLCPAFHKSVQFYSLLLGTKGNDAHDEAGKPPGRPRLGTSRTTDKIGNSLTKLRHGVMAKSMEGLVDEKLDPALDIADICENGEKEESLSNCSGSIGEILEFRDLTAWRVSIPRLSTAKDVGGKPFFVYVIEVQRIDVTSQKTNAEDLQWSVARRYLEFYALESKLTEFHGEFENAKLPSRSKLFSGKGLDELESKMKPFESYLQCLLQNPSLKRSEILFTFLTSTEEFTVAASQLGKMIKNVPIPKLTKEKPELKPFIAAYFASTQAEPAKPSYDSVIGGDFSDAGGEKPIKPHPLFHNNQDAKPDKQVGHCHKYYGYLIPKQEEGVYDTLMYLALKVFKIQTWKGQFLQGLRILCRNTADHFVEFAIAKELVEVLNVGRIVHLCNLLEGAIFEPQEPRTDEMKLERKARALENFLEFLRPLIGKLIGQRPFDHGISFVFESLQDPVINKQLAYTLFDTALVELFPEMEVKIH